MGLVSKGGHVAAVAMCLSGLVSAPVLAQGSVTTEQLLSLIQEQQRQIDELKAALAKTRGTAEAASAEAKDVKQEISKPDFLGSVKFGGLMEVEATSSSDFAGSDSSDIALAKVELYADAKPFEFVSTHLQLLYEDDGDENIVLDEAFAMLGDPDKFPLYAQGGKWPMPFGGLFETNMSTDPLTKDLGETREAAVLAGAAWKGFVAEGYVYNGDSRKLAESESLDQFGANLGYGDEFADGGFNLGVGYISNIADSNVLTDTLGAAATGLADYVPGGEIHGFVTYKAFTVRGAYMKALDPFQPGELAFNGGGAQPTAWYAEFVFGTEFFGRSTIFAATVQGTEEALALGLPHSRYGVAASVEVMPKAWIIAEYLHDKDYGVDDGGTGENAHTGTVKLAVEF
jgi:hypothetical protein